MSEFREKPRTYMRPHQVESAQAELGEINRMLSAPPHIQNQIGDRAKMVKRRRRIEKTLESDSPKPYEGAEKDKAVERMRELESEFTEGMPTAAEMRRTPPGAIDKHMSWEARNKKKILEWKAINLRLHASGDHDVPNPTEISNIERLRPVGGSGELNMDNAVISGKSFFFPPGGPEIKNVMSDEDREKLAQETAELVLSMVGEKGKTARAEPASKAKGGESD